MTVRPVKIVGRRGNWLAEVEGRLLAVLHSTWRIGGTGYFDPMLDVKLEGLKYRRLVEALDLHNEVVIQKDRAPDNFARDGYVGVFRFEDLRIGADGSIRLTLGEQTAEPAKA